ncbi:hypothetical protein [Streptomyces sp. NPDC017529]|uniref:hypothetical protein n=1 Tax=Streptomyces sp. NPDC017529 TaxID=3365000 RepID=UPI003790FCC7
MTENRKRNPYDAEHVQIIDRGYSVVALYIPDPEQAKDPAYVWNHLLDRTRYEAVEVVAEARRFYKCDGAPFSGWVVESGLGHTDPLPNKREALEQLRRAISAYFAR